MQIVPSPNVRLPLRHLRALGLSLALLCLALPCRAAEGGKDSFLASIDWVKGPAKAPVGTIGDVQVPEGFMFTGAQGTQALMERMGNQTNGRELGFMAPTSMVWFVVYEFSDIGYVKDAEKEKLDPDAILKSIRRGTEEANQMRKDRGIPPLNIVGWEIPPRYNPESNNLEWSIRAESEGEAVLNHNVRVLGRKGVMEMVLVGDPQELKAAMPQFATLLTGYTFQTGQRYAEYKPGDKIAKYGLAALVVGGAGVAAAKLGLFAVIAAFFKKAWKLVVIAVVGIAAFVRKLFTGGRRQSLDG